MNNYNILLSSPGDVKIERDLVRKNCEELNVILNKFYDINLTIIGWETHSYSEMGEEAQDVLNKQLMDEYDLYLGIMWHRFGTQTKHYKSGTEEEFYDAYTKNLNKVKNINISFYFRESDISIDVDLNQLGLVRDFKEKIRSLGVYTQQYKSNDIFEAMIRKRLFFFVLENNSFQTKSNINAVTSQTIISSQINKINLLYNDFSKYGEELQTILNQFVIKTQEQIETLESLIVKQADEIEIRNYIPKFMNNLTVIINEVIPNLYMNYHKFSNNYLNLFKLQSDLFFYAKNTNHQNYNKIRIKLKKSFTTNAKTMDKNIKNIIESINNVKIGEGFSAELIESTNNLKNFANIFVEDLIFFRGQINELLQKL